MNQLMAMRAFIRVVEATSFSRAANQLDMPRSTVSKLVTDLETHLGVRLIRRTTRTVSITAEGQEYYLYAVRLIAGIDDADNALRAKKEKPRGHLRLEVQVTFAYAYLIPALPEFYREFPDITLALGINDRMVNIVGEGVDCAIRGGKIQDQSVIARQLTSMNYVTVASPAYLAAMGFPRSPEDLQSNHRRINYLFSSSGKTEPLLFNRGAEHTEITGCQFSASEGSGMRDLILAGLGIGQHLQEFIQPQLSSGNLVQILPEWHRPALPFHIIYQPDSHQNVRLRAFVEWATSRFRPVSGVTAG
ncbi:LysR family transcriptional regulator (plasmid) [Enterobacter mori]|uniref:LysR family transcriptional regulator n=1 Tax=Enterobacter mori TaxID=539813 RepID=UPI001ED9FB5D|nr:LysR family transcriptional regulator [Enterobacter mori]UKJ23751.1 LysR family transcriptional regulator [Enterobacter mori]